MIIESDLPPVLCAGFLAVLLLAALVLFFCFRRRSKRAVPFFLCPSGGVHCGRLPLRPQCSVPPAGQRHVHRVRLAGCGAGRSVLGRERLLHAGRDLAAVPLQIAAASVCQLKRRDRYEGS